MPRSLSIPIHTLETLQQWLAAFLAIGLRLWLAEVFFNSGLTKIASWDTTIALFSDEYNVPLLSPLHAAWLATATELILPVLLVLGLFTRSVAISLFVFNAVAVISYPDISEVGVKDHLYWGMFLLVLFVHGAGKLALDEVPLLRQWKRRFVCAT